MPVIAPVEEAGRLKILDDYCGVPRLWVDVISAGNKLAGRRQKDLQAERDRKVGKALAWTGCTLEDELLEAFSAPLKSEKG
jgi:hypothetical protein